MSASSKTMKGALPPSSKDTCTFGKNTIKLWQRQVEITCTCNEGGLIFYVPCDAAGCNTVSCMLTEDRCTLHVCLLCYKRLSSRAV